MHFIFQRQGLCLVDNDDKYVTRKEFDDRQTALIVQTTQLQSLAAQSQSQITQLTNAILEVGSEMRADSKETNAKLSNLATQVAISSKLNKYLWPTVTLLSGIIAYIIGVRGF